MYAAFLRLTGRNTPQASAPDLDARRQWAKRLADSTFDGLLIHRNGTILSMNRALVRLLGCREVEMLGQHFANCAIPSQVAALRAELDAPALDAVEFTLIAADKSERQIEMISQTIDHEGLPATVTAMRDVTAARADRARINQLQNTDGLTGLPNRTLFIERLAASLARNDAAGGTTALLTIDLDRFKAINERLGRQSGDHLLRQVAERLTSMLHESDTLARISGDKFGVIQPHAAAATRAMNLAGRIDAAFKQPFVVDGHVVRASVSVGIAIYPDHAADLDTLMKASSFALSLAAQNGGGSIHLFSHEDAQAADLPSAAPSPARDAFRANLTEAQRLAQDLRVALKHGEISLEYQPVFKSRDLSLAGFEALARWRHPLEGWIPPATFIPLAEQAGLIHDIGAYVLETACGKAAAAGEGITMAVNLSPLQFRDPQLAGKISAILQKTGLAPARLELEVTEGLLIDNAEAARAALQTMRSIGVSIALDDFGTGYSSLSYLCDFPFSRLKIDKRFVQALGKDPNADAIIAAILSLARNLNLEVTAEGVETPAQLTFLQEQGCHLVQGFLLGRPGAQVGLLQSLVKSPGTPPKPSLVIAN
jgi:diguanylate cyclase (GGDEF)-like protein/PAS domain S-box-containing protein